MTKSLIIAVGDTHINSSIGLCLPSFNLDDGGTYKASKKQRALWEAWLDFWQTMSKIEADRKILFLNGDVGELDINRRTTQLITVNKANVLSLIVETLAPALDVVDDIYVIRGTIAHVGKSAWIEEALADDLGAIPNGDAKSHWHFRGVCEGVKLDITHHAAMGRLPWTEKNAANKIASIVIYRYLHDMKQPIPDIVFRSHNHRYSDSGGNYDTFAVCLPCWQLKTEYVFRLGQENTLPDIGGVYAICEDGKYTYDKILYKPRTNRVWQTKI